MEGNLRKYVPDVEPAVGPVDVLDSAAPVVEHVEDAVVD